MRMNGRQEGLLVWFEKKTDQQNCRLLTTKELASKFTDNLKFRGYNIKHQIL
jgi:hypothetical protein